MRPIFTLFAGVAILFCSCSSSHKVQGSDDPGYSSGSSRSGSSAGQSDYYSTAPSDNYVRMKTTDDARWSQFDDNNSYDNYYSPSPMVASPYYGFGYSPYAYGYGMYGYPAMSIGMGFWDPYFGWNNYFMWNMGYNPYFYNPYYGGGVLIVQQPGYYAGGTTPGSGVAPVYNHLSAFNASTYHGGSYVSGSGRSFRNGGRVTFSSPSNSNFGSGRSFSNNNNSRSANPPNYTPRTSGGNNNSFGGSQSQQPARSLPSGGSGGGFGGGGGMSRGGGSGGFRH